MSLSLLKPAKKQLLFIDSYPLAAATRVCVIVPVRNEGNNLQRTLEALRNQADGEGITVPHELYEVLLLVNNSTDASYQIAADYARAHPSFRLFISDITLSASQANIGTVRGLLMDEAAHRLKLTGNANTIIASTDGDTVVDSQWISFIIKEIDKGADAVGGRILTISDNGSARRHHLRDVTYRYLLARAESLIDPQEHDPWPCHFQYFGANMAVTREMYEQAGCLPQVAHLEDMAFHQALIQQDARIRKSTEVKVFTSSRTDGRVKIGFSEQLKRWAAEHSAKIPQMVEAIGPALHSYQIRNQLRKCWADYNRSQLIDETQLAAIANHIQVKKSWLYSRLISAVYFGTFWHVVEQEIKTNETELQPIQEAIAQLRSFIYGPGTTAFRTNLAGTFRSVEEVDA